MYYPAFLNLRGRKCLVIGNGEVARRKARSLREAGARVTVAVGARHPGKPGLQKACALPLQRYFLIIAATSDRRFNSKIARQCLRQSRLVNVVDDPGLSSFISPSNFKRGPLQIAVSTQGASPVLARHIRKTIARKWGKSWGGYLKFLQASRRKIIRSVRDSVRRRKIFTNAASKKIISLLGRGRLREAKREFLKKVP